MAEATTELIFSGKCPPIKCENPSEDEHVTTACDTSMELTGGADYNRRSKQTRQDPTSHRIIEKRRRDRMNNCLADLARLIPPDYLKKGRGRVEKTEIIEMATRYIKFLQSKRNSPEQVVSPAEYIRRGFQECLSETMRFLVDKQGYYASDSMCMQLVNHLQHHCGKTSKGDVNKKQPSSGDTSSQGSSSSHGSHNQQDMLTHNGQHINQVDSEETTIHKHSNSYPMCNNEKDYCHSMESNQNESSNTSVNRNNSSPDRMDNGLERRTSFSQHKSSSTNNNHTYNISMDTSSNLENEENSRMNMMRNMLFRDTSSQDARKENVYSPVSYNLLQNNCESSLRNVRKQDLTQGEIGNFNSEMDNHSYKFKNTIKQRFSQSQSTDYRSSSPSDGLVGSNLGSISSNDPSPPRREPTHGSAKFNHKRKKVSEHHNRHNISDNCDQSSSGTNSSDNNSKHNGQMYGFKHNRLIDSKDSLLEDSVKSDVSVGKFNSRVNVNNKKYEDNLSCMSNSIGVPIFALHAKGSFYVPMNVDYDSLSPFLGSYDLLGMESFQPNVSLYPVTINVNFQPEFTNNKSQLPNISNRNDKKSW